MSEANTAPQPDQLIHNHDIALEMAYAQKPYWEDEHAVRRDLMSIPESHPATREALLGVAARIAIEGQQAIEEVQTNYLAGGDAIMASVQSNEIASSPEAAWSPEEIKAFVEAHPIGATISTSMFDHRVRTPGNSHRGDQTSDRQLPASLKQFIVEDLARSLATANEQESRQFAEEGVSELITVVPIKDLAAQQKEGYTSKSQLAGRFENGHILMYKTMTRGRTQYDQAQQEQYGRAGRYTNFNMIVKDEEVAGLISQLQQHPETARHIMDSIATASHLDRANGNGRDGQTGIGRSIAEFWKGEGQEGRKDIITSRPPYEKWKELNGGVNRIALRTNINVGPDQAEIIEF